MKRGFTLIELLVVIAIIGILSSVILASLSTARGKANDAARLEEMQSVETALELYHAAYGTYPSSNYLGCGTWETTGADSGNFVAALTAAGYLPRGVNDPEPSTNSTCGNYAYYFYPPNYDGCVDSFYVLGIRSTDGYGTGVYPNSPGWSCSGRDWQQEFSWVTGKYN